MPAARQCFECGGVPAAGETVAGGPICSTCWQLLLRTATSQVCDRIIELANMDHYLHPVSVSRVVATVLPDRADRLRVGFELRARGLTPCRASGKRSPELLALVEELRDEGLPPAVIGRRRNLGVTGSPGICANCGKERFMAGRIDGSTLCSVCWQTDERVVKACLRCGEIDYLNRNHLCRGCRRRDELKALFTPELLSRRPSLRRARDILLRADARYLDNMMRKRSTWWALCQLLTDGTDITHETLDTLGRPGAGMLRSFLVVSGVLPERDERFHAFEQWIRRTAQTVIDDTDRGLFTGFARWRHLRKARSHSRTRSQFAGRRRELALVHALLHMLHTQGLAVRSADQAILDIWLAAGPAERLRVKSFLQWCRANGACKTLTFPRPPPHSLPPVFLIPEHERTALLGQILDPQQDTDPGLRLAAGLVIIYGFRCHEITSLSLTDIILEQEAVLIRFGADPLQLPDELGEYARQTAARRSITRFGGATEDTQWLFPGPLHGHPISSLALSKRLAAIGVRPHRARATALGQLAQQLPPPILARLTGLAPSTTVRWNNAVSASYAGNLPSLGASTE